MVVGIVLARDRLAVISNNISKLFPLMLSVASVVL